MCEAEGRMGGYHKTERIEKTKISSYLFAENKECFTVFRNLQASS